jgi:hypothetical protein
VQSPLPRVSQVPSEKLRAAKRAKGKIIKLTAKAQ